MWNLLKDIIFYEKSIHLYGRNITLNYANFFQWWNALPDNLKDQFVNEQSNENNQISDKTSRISEVLKKFEFIDDDMNYKKPSLEELKYWIETKQL